MKSISKLSALLLVFVLSFAVLQAPAGAVTAQEKTENTENSEKKEENKDKEDTKEDVVYKYVAQPGDSYTLIARKAVQTYGLKEDVKLSRGQIIFAETKLTQEAGSPQLSVGQEVTIKESSIANWADQAKKLSEENEKLWGEYAAGADFNTDQVGESSSNEDAEEQKKSEDS